MIFIWIWLAAIIVILIFFKGVGRSNEISEIQTNSEQGVAEDLSLHAMCRMRDKRPKFGRSTSSRHERERGP